jgi:hypothetical protein
VTYSRDVYNADGFDRKTENRACTIALKRSAAMNS